MKTIDLTDMEYPVSEPNEDYVYALLAQDATWLFRFGEGNKYPWEKIKSDLEKRVASSSQTSLSDVIIAVGGRPEIIIEGQCAEMIPDAVTVICQALIDREIVAPSTQVSVTYQDHDSEEIGALGDITRSLAYS